MATETQATEIDGVEEARGTDTPAVPGVRVRRVTAKWLARHDACDGQAEIFEKRWPEGCEVTAKNLRAAAQIGLDLGWFAQRALTPRLYDAYAAQRKSLYDAYAAQCKSLYDAYAAQRKPLYDAYAAQCVECLIKIMELAD